MEAYHNTQNPDTQDDAVNDESDIDQGSVHLAKRTNIKKEWRF